MSTMTIIEVAVGLAVIAIEILILWKLSHHEQQMDEHLLQSLKMIREHTEKLEIHVDHLDRHSHRIETTIDRMQDQVEDLKGRIGER